MPVSEDPHVQIAVLKTELDYLRKDLDEIKGDMKAVRETLTQAKGGWKTLMLVAGIASTVGATLAKLLPFLSFAPR